MKYLLLLLLTFSFSSCHSQSCDSLPSHYVSYQQALTTIRHASFKIHQTCNTSSSSWIRAAEYYSCDGQTGFFVFKTDKQWYIHAGVPLSVWEGFKKADSRGRYYNQNIKYKYHFNP
jgi:hypothetical protein